MKKMVHFDPDAGIFIKSDLPKVVALIPRKIFIYWVWYVGTGVFGVKANLFLKNGDFSIFLA